MKYIRTKDGRIIDLERKGLYNLPVYNFDTKENVLKAHLKQEERNCCCIDNNIFYDYCYEDGNIWEFEIVKQADTIEELCDLFVADEGCKMFYARENGFRTLDIIRRYCGLENCKSLYAYIYGENGDIIKVAKMNEKGELELL